MIQDFLIFQIFINVDEINWIKKQCVFANDEKKIDHYNRTNVLRISNPANDIVACEINIELENVIL